MPGGAGFTPYARRGRLIVLYPLFLMVAFPARPRLTLESCTLGFEKPQTNLVETAHWKVYLMCLLQAKSSKIFNRPVSRADLIAGRILEAVS